MASCPYRKADHAFRSVELVRLVIRHHHQPQELGDLALDSFPGSPTVVLEDHSGHFEGRNKMFGVHLGMLFPKILVRQLREGIPRCGPRLKARSNGVVHGPPEVVEQGSSSSRWNTIPLTSIMLPVSA